MIYDVVALGELLIDFTSYGQSAQGNPVFEANPGGAPGNVLAMLAKLGKRTAFIGKVGADLFGQSLISALNELGIDTAGVLTEESANTTLAFVHNRPDGERQFSFFRKPGADTLLKPEDVKWELVRNCRIFHFGSLSLSHQPAREATQSAIWAAQEAGALISFDPNLRPLLWSTLEEARRQIAWGCSVCHILKIADEELAFLTGLDDPEKGIDSLKRQYPQIQLILLTKGKRGAEGFWGDCHVSHPTFTEVTTIDTTGAGDTFLGACLSKVLAHGLNRPDQKALEDMIIFANAAASLITTKKGALRVMPRREEILRLMGQ